MIYSILSTVTKNEKKINLIVNIICIFGLNLNNCKDIK